jgi:hypothetical protein
MRQDPTIDGMKLQKRNLWLPVSHWKELGAISRKTLIPISALVRKAVAEFLERERQKK